MNQPAKPTPNPSEPAPAEPAAPADWKAKVQAAYQMVFDLCNQKRRWIMSIPVREDYDPDCVIVNGLKAAEQRIAALESELEIAKSFRFNLEHAYKLDREMFESERSKDSERLDWLEKTALGVPRTVKFMVDRGANVLTGMPQAGYLYDKIREAIDAAMLPEPPRPETGSETR